MACVTMASSGDRDVMKSRRSRGRVRNRGILRDHHFIGSRSRDRRSSGHSRSSSSCSSSRSSSSDRGRPSHDQSGRRRCVHRRHRHRHRRPGRRRSSCAAASGHSRSSRCACCLPRQIRTRQPDTCKAGRRASNYYHRRSRSPPVLMIAAPRTPGPASHDEAAKQFCWGSPWPPAPASTVQFDHCSALYSAMMLWANGGGFQPRIMHQDRGIAN